MTDYKGLTGKELVAIAKEKGVTYPAGCKVSELRALLIQWDEENETPEDDIEPVDEELALMDADDEAADNEPPFPTDEEETDGTNQNDSNEDSGDEPDEEEDESNTQDQTFDIGEIPDYIQSIEGFDLDDVLSRIVSVDDEEHFIKAVFYGENGTGKTTLAGSFPSVVIVDANEKGTESIKGTGAKKFVLKGWEDLYGIYWFLKSGKHQFKTVVIDTVTQLEDMCLRYVMDKDIESDSTRDPEMANIRDYGKRAQLLKSWIIYFRDLPMHVIFLAQKGSSSEEVAEDESEVYPLMSEKARKVMCGAVSIIGYTYKKEKSVPSTKDPNKLIAKTDYCLRIGPSERYLTKIRVPKGTAYKKVLVDPTFDKLIEITKPTTKEEE